MAIRYGRSDVKQTTTGFRGPLMVQSLTSAKSKFLSLTFFALLGASNLLSAIFYLEWHIFLLKYSGNS